MSLGWIMLAAASTLFAAVGCGSGGDQKKAPAPPPQQGTERTWRIDRPPPTTTRGESRPLPVAAQPVVVKQGPAPLAYIVEAPMIVSVVDTANDQRLARAPVGARTIVRVETRNGIFFGDENVAPGPLPADHRFAIYLESDQASEVRSDVVSPMPTEPDDQPRSGRQPRGERRRSQ